MGLTHCFLADLLRDKLNLPEDTEVLAVSSDSLIHDQICIKIRSSTFDDYTNPGCHIRWWSPEDE